MTKSRIEISIIAVFLLLSVMGNAQKIADKLIIGTTAKVRIKQGRINFLARVDTGAKSTSIHANKIRVKGNRISFTIVNHKGKKARLKSKIIDEKIVKNADYREKRYYVYLTIKYKDISKKTLVNLNNRSDSEYKMLLGRNWLSGDFIVDVDMD